MKATVIFYLCVATTVIIPSTIAGDYYIVDQLEKMANGGHIINNVFKPLPNGHLGSGGFGIIYKGLLGQNEIIVAMKFMSNAFQFDFYQEVQAYKWLQAISNSSVEAYGIPTVHYSGKWDDYYLIALTYLETTILEKYNSGEMSEIDMLIIFREFVRITKYIHSRGICHNDMKPDNMMFGKHQGFIIDYNLASVMDSIVEGRQCAKADWMRFLLTICRLINIRFDFIKYDDDPDNEPLLDENHYRENIVSTMATLETVLHVYPALGEVFVEFAKHAFEDEINNNQKLKDKYAVSHTTSSYDELYMLITKQIEKFGCGEQALVSWLSDAQKKEALIAMANSSSIYDIRYIKNPFRP